MNNEQVGQIVWKDRHSSTRIRRDDMPEFITHIEIMTRKYQPETTVLTDGKAQCVSQRSKDGGCF